MRFKFWLFLFCIFSVSELNAKALRVVTTTEDLASIARFIGKDKVEVAALVRGVQDPHYIQVRPSDMIKVSRAELLVIVGMGLDGWILPVIDGARNPEVRIGAQGFLDASSGIELLEVPQGKVDRSLGDVHPQGNPHYWLDPSNGKIIAKNMMEKLSLVSPSEREFFKENFEEFSKKLDQAVQGWKKELVSFKGKQVITYHTTWSYFMKAFNMSARNYVEIRAGVPPSPKHLQELISQIKNERIELIITEPYFDIRLPEKIAASSGASLRVLAPSVGAFPQVKDYFDLFEYNIQELLRL